jgi:hypothetical protein
MPPGLSVEERRTRIPDYAIVGHPDRPDVDSV